MLLIGLFTFAISACGSGGADSAAESSKGSGSLAVRVNWPDIPRSAASSSTAAQASDEHFAQPLW